jgi:diadenosine tetraphosphatase ApaH/serine/threonine PP2A family protein phosphatase
MTRARSKRVFAGNPADVCPLEEWLPDDVMQSIAAENNLSETAFFIRSGEGYKLRWFTPLMEVDFCGHATLASAFVAFNFLHRGENSVSRHFVPSRGVPGDPVAGSAHCTEISTAHPKLTPLLGRLRELIEPTRERIGEERLRWLKALPATHMGAGFAVVHASPKNLWWAPMANASDEEIQKTYAELDAPVVIYGHIQVSYVWQLRGMTVANAGSISQSYDGDRRAAYAVIDGETVTIRRVEYDVESEARELLHSGLPHAEWLSRVLLVGKYCPPE